MSSQGSAQGWVDAGTVFANLRRDLGQAQQIGWWRVGDQQLVGFIQELQSFGSQVASVQIDAVGEAGRRGLPGAAGFKKLARWLRSVVAVAPHQANQRATLAEALPEPELAPTRVALAAGELSPGHAAVVVRTMDAITKIPGPVSEGIQQEAQAMLVGFAGRLDPAELGQAARRLLHNLDPDAGERLAHDEDAQHEARCLTLWQERSGMWALRGLLPPVDGAAFATVLDVLSSPRPAQDGTPDRRTAGQRRAESVGHLAALFLAARPADPLALPSRAGSPTRMLAMADLATLTADLTVKGGQAGIPPGQLETGDGQGWDISPLAVQTLACDAEIVPVLTNGEGRALDVGTTIYPFPPRIRTAIELRDRHCTWPGCSAKSAWCDAHHLTPYRLGGPTSEANGTLLCGPHHRHVHDKGHTGQIVDGHVLWPPDLTYPPEADGKEDGRSNAVQQQLERALNDLARRWHAQNRPPPDTG
jgi:hypothetical protein